MDEADRALHTWWMEKSVEERIICACELYDAERAIIAKLVPNSFSAEDKRQFVFYHSYGYEMPEGARRE